MSAINTKSSPSRKTSSTGNARRATSAKPAAKAQKTQKGQAVQRGDRASVTGEAKGPQAKNPVNFSAWSGGLLKSGSQGGEVATLQKQLGVKADGIFGKDTKAAVEKFQKDHNLKADGLAGDKTREALQGNAPRQPQGPQPDAAQAPAKVEGAAKVDGAAKTAPLQPGEKSAFGDKLAKDARRIAESGVAGSGRNCKRGVRMALEKQGMKLDGVSAYMAANQLAKNDKFKEMKGLERSDLRNLPPGATVVWNKSKGHPHGHISIAMGNGREASDVMRNQIVNYPSSYRVFMPQ